jgi:hypothetical protein
MKNYRDYIFENASLPDFQKDYESICGKLYAFWGTLDDVLEDIVDINSNRNAEEIAANNAHFKQPRQQQAKKPNLPIKGQKYNFMTNSGNTIMIEIIEPNAQDKDKTALPNRSIVKTITPPITQHTAEWSKLSVVKKQTTT